ncbi:gluconokinase [Arthrobacter sp. FW306-05-C]|uniref:gluconokinase n=1 Tax=Arthrobacter TaxID=1663 RepID=UPI001EF04236|nr:MULTISPECIES: gluconokinase [Arthrobacter]MDP9986693.1 gluconokinase [Arthrobacter oryzae]UKA67813.1 gluconokinase [Arthrobacter sp. FW306-05-C]UKA72340.1 gluconokinase [Arthrobacter sp. FW306-06-A]
MQYPATHLVVMGVAGSGKSTLAAALSQQLGWACAEADEFHPESNIAKMTQGIPLQDEDRWPWLQEIRDWMSAQAAAGTSTVLTCSALKRSYRHLLSQAEGRVVFLHLDGGADLISQRMQGREGHFMPPTLLPSQLATLEPLTQEELESGSLRLDIARSPEELVAAVVNALNLPSGQAPQAS